MDSTEQEHSHYWPGAGKCIPITPQAIRFGYVFPVYVTKTVWADAITWQYQELKETSSEKRIYDLLDSCYTGMGKALATAPDRVMYSFKHWYWDRHRPASTKPIQGKFGARLLLNPETEEPWLLIFHPTDDDKEVLNRGEHDENRKHEADSGSEQHADGSEVDLGSKTI